MRRGNEFTAWLAARWPTLVRTLVFLGLRQHEAEEVAGEAVARILPAWERERRGGDVDVLVLRALLDERDRLLRRRDTDPREAPAPEEPDLPPALSDRLERRRDLEAHLATLPEGQRVRTVLVHVAGLTDAEAEEVVEQPGATPPLPLSGPEVRDACEAVPTGPAPVAAVLARSRRRRRTAWTRGAAVVVAAAVVVGATTWWTSGEDGSAQGEVTPARNPLPVPWYADGRLHLARVEVEASGLQTLLDVPDGVVYGDDAGRVVHVDDGGEVQEIGETVPGSRLAVEPDNGWVAWADPGDGDPELVVHDTLARAEVGRRSLAAAGAAGQPVAGYGPIAIDDERVFYSSPDGDFAWEPLIEVSFALAGTMVDTAEESRVTRSDGVMRVTPLPYRTGVVIDGDDARLTHDGRYVFGVRESDSFDRLRVYDVDTGSPVAPLFSPSDEAVSWAYQDGTFYFALLHKLQDKTYQDMLQMPSKGDYRIYSCRAVPEPVCEKLAEVPEEVPDPPVFPQ